VSWQPARVEAHWHVWVRSPSRKTLWQWLDAGGQPTAFGRREDALGWLARQGHVRCLAAPCRARRCAPDVPRPEAF